MRQLVNEREPFAQSANWEVKIPIIIVSFRNYQDVIDCVKALRRLALHPKFDVYVCENGGAPAYDALISALTTADGLCAAAGANAPVAAQSPRFVRMQHFLLRDRDARVIVAEASQNFGYAGAVNAWIRVLMTDCEWPGVWILNPDTQPEPLALAELTAWSQARRKGMVGCRIVPSPQARYGFNRGLRWRSILASTAGVDKGKSTAREPDPARLEQRLDAPSGASMYVTRECIETIGLMDEKYFLYFEDLDWGYRAKTAFGIGYAHRAIVVHPGGTTIGSVGGRSKCSPLSVYLDFRNRVHFVRDHHPRWLVWTLLMLLARSCEYGLVGAFTNLAAALRGVHAGLIGETGRPDHVFDFDKARPCLRKASGNIGDVGRPYPSTNRRAKARCKIALSVAFYVTSAAIRRLRGMIGRPGPHRLIVLYYHNIPSRLRANFGRQLDLLAAYTTVVSAGYDGPVGRGGHSVAITFDDAFTSVLDNAVPELRARHLPATIFVPVGAMGRAPAWEIECRDMPDPEIVATADALRRLDPELVSIGAHTLTHPHLPGLSPARARAEIAGCRSLINQTFGIDAGLFAFPYGEHDAASIELCREAGYRHVFTNLPYVVDPNSGGFVRGRVLVGPEDGPLEFYLKMAGAYAWMPYASMIKKCFGRLLRNR